MLVVVGVVVAAVGSWLGWCATVVQHPRVDSPGPVDAVLVLGGLDGPERTEYALDLVHRGLTHTVVLSIPIGGEDELARQTCKHPPSGVQVICFQPSPSTTQGEAEELRRLAGEHGWTSVAVVTSRYHISRSRLIVGRCFHGQLRMLVSSEPISVRDWAYQYLYQTAGYLKAELLTRGC